ncbi:RNA recognition motif protein (macronuclear) [Tetrahymena thermophila SB210]|uniref:RNA recognition motif protein n=1 Tax=Tetrahymena thermophila (strain SB210) TaxID=312017 RepID=I7LXC4_TETTS|nr:RNA recognition motif protein [Tetrahymena thermophila SB210]EAS04362.2 RNA recognition motif protein [Tetrahymena thermophila SB210]|eukprot:XP_001024607.2 RNA recognition motif protein [Tetrahymena thermophila SB210]
MIQDIPQAQDQTLENVFISGIDPSVTEKELQDLIRFTVGSQLQISISKIIAAGQERLLGEVKCKLEEATILHHKLNNTHLKNCFLKLVPQSCMKSIIIQNLPKVFNEKDLFKILNELTPNSLKRIIIADNPEVVGETVGVAVAIYQNYELALKAIKALKQQGELFKCKIDVCWKEPDFDIIKELSMQTKVLCVKNISSCTETSKIKDAFSVYGTVVRIQRYSTHAFVEFLNIESAKNALAALSDKRFEGGIIWHIYPAKKLDIERQYEDVDKNRTFSKNFLPETDQQILRKFLFDGQLPALDSKVSQTASNLLQHIKSMQQNMINSLQIKADTYRQLQNSMNPQQNNNNNNNNNLNNLPIQQQIPVQNMMNMQGAMNMNQFQINPIQASSNNNINMNMGMQQQWGMN